MDTILVVIYIAWAFYSGWKFLSGRSEWLDAPDPLHKAAKVICSGLVGIVIGAFYFIYWVLKLFAKLKM